MINVAVLGYGTVGSGVVEVLENNKDEITKKDGEELKECKERTGRWAWKKDDDGDGIPEYRPM